jgi:hypothetical protein
LLTNAWLTFKLVGNIFHCSHTSLSSKKLKLAIVFLKTQQLVITPGRLPEAVSIQIIRQFRWLGS